MLPLPQLINIISSDELNVPSEEHIYKAVMDWIRHNIADRRPYLSKVMSVLNFLFGCTRTTRLIENNIFNEFVSLVNT